MAASRKRLRKASASTAFASYLFSRLVPKSVSRSLVSPSALLSGLDVEADKPLLELVWQLRAVQIDFGELGVWCEEAEKIVSSPQSFLPFPNAYSMWVLKSPMLA